MNDLKTLDNYYALKNGKINAEDVFENAQLSIMKKVAEKCLQLLLNAGIERNVQVAQRSNYCRAYFLKECIKGMFETTDTDTVDLVVEELLRVYDRYLKGTHKILLEQRKGIAAQCETILSGGRSSPALGSNSTMPLGKDESPRLKDIFGGQWEILKRLVYLSKNGNAGAVRLVGEIVNGLVVDPKPYFESIEEVNNDELGSDIENILVEYLKVWQQCRMWFSFHLRKSPLLSGLEAVIAYFLGLLTKPVEIYDEPGKFEATPWYISRGFIREFIKREIIGELELENGNPIPEETVDPEAQNDFDRHQEQIEDDLTNPNSIIASPPPSGAATWPDQGKYQDLKAFFLKILQWQEDRGYRVTDLRDLVKQMKGSTYRDSENLFPLYPLDDKVPTAYLRLALYKMSVVNRSALYGKNKTRALEMAAILLYLSDHSQRKIARTFQVDLDTLGKHVFRDFLCCYKLEAQGVAQSLFNCAHIELPEIMPWHVVSFTRCLFAMECSVEFSPDFDLLGFIELSTLVGKGSNNRFPGDSNKVINLDFDRSFSEFSNKPIIEKMLLGEILFRFANGSMRKFQQEVFNKTMMFGRAHVDVYLPGGIKHSFELSCRYDDGWTDSLQKLVVHNINMRYSLASAA